MDPSDSAHPGNGDALSPEGRKLRSGHPSDSPGKGRLVVEGGCHPGAISGENCIL